MGIIGNLVSKPTQAIKLFHNTTKADGTPLVTKLHNIRGRVGEYTVSVYLNADTMYLEVSRPEYHSRTKAPWVKGFLDLSFHSKRMDGATEVSIGTLQLPLGGTLKVELRDEEVFDVRDPEPGKPKTYKACTLCVFGGRLPLEDLEEAIRLNQDRKEAAASGYKTEEEDAPEDQGVVDAISNKLGDDPGF